MATSHEGAATVAAGTGFVDSDAGSRRLSLSAPIPNSQWAIMGDVTQTPWGRLPEFTAI